jgi:hypothetical protein
MLEMLDLDRKLSKEAYKDKIRALRLHLNECQRLCLKAGIPTTLVFEGWDAAGKGTHIGELSETLDPRGFRVHPIAAPARKSGCGRSCGGSGSAFPTMDTSASSTAAGTGASSSSGSTS